MLHRIMRSIVVIVDKKEKKKCYHRGHCSARRRKSTWKGKRKDEEMPGLAEENWKAGN